MKTVIFVIIVAVILTAVYFLYRVLAKKDTAHKEIPDDRYPLF